MYRLLRSLILVLLVLPLLTTCSKSDDSIPIAQYSISVQISPKEGGFVVPSSVKSNEGENISILASPSTNYLFKNWSGDISGTMNPTTVLMNSDKSITAVFELKDSDGDGVTDDIDSCPDTPNGALVNANGCSSEQDPDKKNELKVLFIGSSYFIYNNLPDMFYQLVKNSGKKIAIDSYMQGGLHLADHASSSITANKIKQQKWDIVVLQGIGRGVAYPDYYTTKPVYPSITILKEKILNNSASTKIIYCMPWAIEDGMTRIGWPDTYEDMQQKIYEKTLEYADEIDFTIAPVGWVWYKVLEKKGYPLHYLHNRDMNHPSVNGSYIMANVLYATIYEKSTIDNVFISGISPEDAAYFQEISSSIVLNDTDLWRITP